jgi:hypothetical protein
MPASTTQEKPFLWGPVRSALLQDAKEHGSDTLLQLCHSEEIRVKDMMVSVLAELGLDNRAMVDEILDELFPQEREPGRLAKALRLVRRRDASMRTDTGVQGAVEIAVEVASSLGNKAILQRAALHEHPTIRASAVRWIYHLWEHDRTTGFEIIDHLARCVVQALLPNIAALESCMGVSLIMFFDHARDTEVRQRLQEIWRRIIAGILRINEAGSKAGNAVRDFVRD